VSSVIVNNPGCKSDKCKYPVVKAKRTNNIASNRRMLLSDSLSIDFTVSTKSSNYVCLTYDLSTNLVLGAYRLPTKSSSDGLTISCTLTETGATSIYLDSTCEYLSKSACSSNSSTEQNTTDDQGLAADAIVGIVLGSITFAVILGVSIFFLFKHLH